MEQLNYCKEYYAKHWWLGLTFGDILDQAADMYPNREALVKERARLTYFELREKAKGRLCPSSSGEIGDRGRTAFDERGENR